MSRFKLSLFLLVVGTCLEVSGQAARTPFSAFGYGDSYGDALIHNQGMGGAGVSNPQFWYLNSMNPALLTNNRLTVFQAGVVLDRRRINSDTLRQNNSGGNLNYLVLGFPLMRNKRTGESKWGSSIGLLPYSNVNYSYVYREPTAGGIDVLYSDRAIGGINEFFWSNGVRLNRYFSVGLKTSFQVGSISSNFSNSLNDPNQPVRYIINVHEFQTLNGVKFTPGFHFKKDSILRKYTFNIGATFDFKSKLNSDIEQVLEQKNQLGNIITSDTTRVVDGTAYLPQRFTIGASFGQQEKWMAAVDFGLVRPNGNQFALGLDTVSVANGWRLSAGIELTPDSRSLGSYLKRITYRTGISAESGTYLVNGNAVKDFGINFGFSLPVSRISSLDVALRTGRRGDIALNGIEENYFKIYFGVTFNDQWFIKRRFD